MVNKCNISYLGLIVERFW